MESYNMPRDNFYLSIKRVYSKKYSKYIIEFRPVYINTEGRVDDRNINKTRRWYIHYDTKGQSICDMEHIIDYLFNKADTNSQYDYIKIDLNHKTILLTTPHKVLLSLWGTAIEILYQLIDKKIIDKTKLAYDIIESTEYPYSLMKDED